MRVLTLEEVHFVSGSDGSDDFAEVLVEIMAEVFFQVAVELFVRSIVAGIYAIHDYFYPPQVAHTSYFIPAPVNPNV